MRQGAALSAILFNLVLDHDINKIDIRGNILTKMVQISVYADDTVIIARSMKALEEALQKLQDAAQGVVLIINQEETKFLVVSKETYKGNNKIAIAGYGFERISNFPYLGSAVNHHHKMMEEISQRIKKGNRAYCTHKSLMTSKLISKQTKKILNITFIRSVVT